ncbi:MAG: dihydroorotase [Bacteroides sp.]
MCKRPLPLVIHDVRLVNEGNIVEANLVVDKDGRISQISQNSVSLNPKLRYSEINGRGEFLLPGVIDTHVHFRDPGYTHKGDIESESRAAVAGGITSYCDMPNTNPQTTSLAAVHEKLKHAAGRSYANFAFYLGASKDNLDEIRRCDPRIVPGIKLFMGSSTGGMQLTTTSYLNEIFKESPLIIATHCETDSIIAENLAKARKAFSNGIPFTEHARIRSTQSCVASVALAQTLAKENDARLHVLHLSAAEELELFRNLEPQYRSKITCETCPHYLYFNEADYDLLQWQIKCNPAIKTASDQHALLEAIKTGVIQTIGSDHAPHLVTEKLKDYEHSPSGIPSIQYSLILMLNLARREQIPFTQIVELMAHTPAKLFGIVDRGFIREGYYADLVFVCEESKSRPIKSRSAESKCDWSPYDTMNTSFFIRRTLVNGAIAYCYTHGIQQPAVGTHLVFNGNLRDEKNE